MAAPATTRWSAAKTAISISSNSISDVVTETGTLGTDEIKSTISIAALAGGVENLTLLGTDSLSGTGNTLNNLITGNSGNNALDGDLGNDTLARRRRQRLAIGDTGDDSLDGGTGNDTLVGGAATTKDSLAGGDNDDLYIVDSDKFVITETGGTDTLQSSVTIAVLADGVEHLTLTGAANINGTGNNLDNKITGNSGDNSLAGGAGLDTLLGGLGNDTLQGDADADSLDGSDGNDNLDGGSENDTVTGGIGNDTLTGGSGSDTLIGGKGDDVYFVDAGTDGITENVNEGIDEVRSTATDVTLADNLENLVLLTGGVNGTGNGAANEITGNDTGQQPVGPGGQRYARRRQGQ